MTKRRDFGEQWEDKTGDYSLPPEVIRAANRINNEPLRLPNPDPLTVEEDALWDPQTRTFVPRRSGLFPLLVGLGLGLIIGAVITTAVLAYGPAVGGEVAAASVPADGGSSAASPSSGAPSVEDDAPLPAAEKPASSDVSVPAQDPRELTTALASETGVASWYDDGSGLYAAVNSYRFGDPRYRVTVCRQDQPERCVTVTVRDFCGCPGARVIDLSPAAFSRLAPLSQGLVRVVVTSGGASATAPATDLEGTP